jgi:hypothetical protein
MNWPNSTTSRPANGRDDVFALDEGLMGG